MTTTEKIIVQLHERTADTLLDADLQLRELGYESNNNTLRFNNNSGSKFSFWPFNATSGITASITQTQGQSQQTNNVIIVNTVANDNDVITVPGAESGRIVVVVNNGANDLQVFPKSGDNFQGEASNASIVLKPNTEENQGSISLLVGKDSSNFQYLNGIVTGYAEPSVAATQVHSIPYWETAGNGGGTRSTTKLVASEQLDSGFSSYANVDSNELLIKHGFSDTTKDVRFSLTNSSSDSSADSIIEVNAGAAGGDPMVRWRQSGGSGTWFNMGRDRAEGSTELKLTYGTDMDSKTLYRVNTDGVFALVGTVGTSKFANYGLGDTTDANNEWVELFDNGTNSVLSGGLAQGTGAAHDLLIKCNSITAITVDTSGDVTFANDVVVTGTFTSAITTSNSANIVLGAGSDLSFSSTSEIILNGDFNINDSGTIYFHVLSGDIDFGNATSNPSYSFLGSGSFQVDGPAHFNDGLASAKDGGATIKATNSSIAIITGDNIGSLDFQGNDLHELGVVGRIKVDAEADHTTGQAKTYMTFHTNTGPAATLAESMRIDSDGNVGVGVSSPEGKVHILTGSAGVVTADSNVDELVIEGSGAAGINILTPDAGSSRLAFGSPTSNLGSIIRYRPTQNDMTIGTNRSGGELIFVADSFTEYMRIDSDGNVGINDSTPSYKLDVNGTGRFTGAVQLDSSTTLGAGADLIGSSTSDIIINTDKFTVSGSTGAIVGRGGLNLYSSEAGKTDWRMTFNLIDADSLRFYAYDEGLATLRPIQIGDSAVGGGTIFSPTSTTLGAGVDLIGSSTSDIIINTDKFTVSGSTGDTELRGVLRVSTISGTYLEMEGSVSSIPSADNSSIVTTSTGASYPFDQNGNLVLTPRTSASRAVVIMATATTINTVFDSSGNVGLGVSTFGTSAAKVLNIGSGTAPTTGVADSVQLFSLDLSAGNTMLGIYTEGTPVGSGTPTQDRTVAVNINGTTYYLLASTAAS